MGWHTILFKGCLDVAAGKPTKEPTGKTLMLDAGTSNFKWMATAWWWGWALISGVVEAQQLAAERILALYAEEKEIGHQLLEQTCPMPHDTFHRMAHATIRKLYFYFLHAEPNLEIVTANNEWWAWRLALDHAGSTPDGQVILPGCRGDGAPLTQIGDAIYRMSQGMPQRGPAASEKWWSDPVYGGGAPSIMRELLGTGPWKFDMPSLPKLHLPMTIARDSHGFRATLAGDPKSEPIISTVEVEFQSPGHHRILFEKNWDPKTQERI